MNKYSDLLKIISNYGGRLWGLFSVFLFIPYYIGFLGIEAYAVIGFYTLLLGIISFADAGLSSSITREFASADSNVYKYDFLILLEKKYQLICFFLVLILLFCAPIIAHKWLISESIAASLLIYYIRLIAVGVCLQLISSFYFGALFGLDKQVQANLVQFVWSIFKSAIVLLVLKFYECTLEVFFIWQIICNLLYVLCLRYLILKKLNVNAQKHQKTITEIPKEVLKYIGGMSLVAIISSINVQADKILVSSFFSLKQYGYYSIASLFSQLPLILATPLVVTLFPVFSRYAANSKYEINLMHVFKKSSFLVTLIILCVTATIFFYGEEIILFWSKKAIDKTNLPNIITVAKILTLGTTFLALQLLFYYLLLAFGKTKYTVYQGIVQISLGIPLLYVGIKYFGMIGATIPWLLINLGSFIYLFNICLSNYILIHKINFLLYTMFVPLTIIMVVFGVFYYAYFLLELNFIFFVICSGLFSVLLNCMLYNKFESRSLFSFKHFVEFNEEYEVV